MHQRPWREKNRYRVLESQGHMQHGLVTDTKTEIKSEREGTVKEMRTY